METRTFFTLMVISLNLFFYNANAGVNGLVFRLEVQLTVRPNIDDFSHFQPSEGIMSKGEKVLAGKYSDYLVAMKAKYGFAKVSSNPAAIVAFFNEERVSLDEAFAIINDESTTDKLVFDRPDTAQTNNIITNTKPVIQYRFEFYTDAAHTLDMLFEKHPEWRGTTTMLQNGCYLVGNFTDHADALCMQSTLDGEGFKRNVLVAYQNNKKIPVLMAMDVDSGAKP